MQTQHHQRSSPTIRGWRRHNDPLGHSEATRRVCRKWNRKSVVSSRSDPVTDRASHDVNWYCIRSTAAFRRMLPSGPSERPLACLCDPRVASPLPPWRNIHLDKDCISALKGSLSLIFSIPSLILFARLSAFHVLCISFIPLPMCTTVK